MYACILYTTGISTVNYNEDNTEVYRSWCSVYVGNRPLYILEYFIWSHHEYIYFVLYYSK